VGFFVCFVDRKAARHPIEHIGAQPANLPAAIAALLGKTAEQH
jgi:hypothetical protein